MHIDTSEQPVLKLGIGDYTCNWGVHFCGLYETEEERDEILLNFLHNGIVAGDLQLYCPAERSVEDFKEAYSKKFPEYSQCLCDDSCCQLFSTKELFYPTGVFCPWDMDKGLNEFFVNSQKNGRRNVRATAEMVWALEDTPGVENLMAYESRLNYFIEGKPWISVCLYNVSKFSGSIIMKVLETHPYTINGGVITRNPFYQDPDIWLKKNAPEFLSEDKR